MEKPTNNCSQEIREAAEALISGALGFSTNLDDSMTYNIADVRHNGVNRGNWEIIVRPMPN